MNFNDLSGLGQPIDSLINRIYDASAIGFEATRIRRKAQAICDAKKIHDKYNREKTLADAKLEIEINERKAESEIRIQDIQKINAIANFEEATPAIKRLIEEEVKKQFNMESIVAQTIPLLSNDARPELLDEDWIMAFLNCARNVSNQKMQILWAKLLAGATHCQNAYSKKTLSILSTMTTHDALMFEKLCSFVITIDEVPYLLHNLLQSKNDDIDLDYLDELGLLHKSSSAVSSGLINCPKIVKINYNDNCIGDFYHVHLSHGVNRLTRSGKEIYSLCAKTIENPKVLDYLFHRKEFDYKSQKWLIDDRDFLFCDEKIKKDGFTQIIEQI